VQYDFARDRLHAALLLLAQEDGPLQERLARAYVEALQRISARDAPTELRPNLAVIQRALSASELGAQVIVDAQGRLIVEMVIDLYRALMCMAD
jgi:hypothetical protein